MENKKIVFPPRPLRGDYLSIYDQVGQEEANERYLQALEAWERLCQQIAMAEGGGDDDENN